MASYFRPSNYSRLVSASYRSSSCRKIFKTPLNCQHYIRVNYSNTLYRQLAQAAPVEYTTCVVATPWYVKLT